jgi:hypothetical protein
MNAKDMVLDFIYYTIVLTIIIGALFLFLNPNYFKAFSTFIKAMAPLFFFMGFLMIKLRWMRKDYKKRKEEGNTEIMLRLSYFDKFTIEVLTFLLPMSISVIVMLSGREYTAIDFIQAGLAFVILYLWNKTLLSHRVD